MLAETKFTLPLKEKEDLEAPSYRQKKKQMVKPESTASTSHPETVNN